MSRFSDTSVDELLVLQRHHLTRSLEIAEELAARGEGLGELDASEDRDFREDAADEATSALTATKPQREGLGRGRRDVRRRRRRVFPTVDAVLARASGSIQEAAENIINASFVLDGVGEPVPERPLDGRPAKYIRLTWGRKTFVYINVRQDHLRIDLALPAEHAQGLRGQVRVRDVQETNPWKVSLYVSGPEDVDAAVDAIRHVHGLLQSGVL
jgi:hypothetical protein